MSIRYLRQFNANGLDTLLILNEKKKKGEDEPDAPCGAVASRGRNAGVVRGPGGGAVVLEPLLSNAD